MLAHLGAMLGDLEAILRYVEFFSGEERFVLIFTLFLSPNMNPSWTMSLFKGKEGMSLLKGSQGISLETVNKEFLVNNFPWFLVNLLTRNSLLRNSQGNFPW